MLHWQQPWHGPVSRHNPDFSGPPPQSEGPFYPDQPPLDQDNDLVRVAGRSGQAKGKILHLTGKVLDDRGRPVSGTRVEIWQCDALGRYHHRLDSPLGADPDFQGFGQMEPAADGVFRFRTIRPVPYPGRAPHIHFKIKSRAFEDLTTQMYVAGEPANQRDYLLNRVPATARTSLIVPLKPADDMEQNTLAGHFDIILGKNTS
ncbi:MAG: intradiol ring-cleavage dioxygenase [Gammaproteobacteria bacterium]|nr:intradiol ring-cleavage dioxygenase [Gammaproteobacteria bacterium]